jgi:hypothetical protein
MHIEPKGPSAHLWLSLVIQDYNPISKQIIEPASITAILADEGQLNVVFERRL